MKRFENKTMVITGTAWGIGKATAIQAAKEGANVVCSDILVEDGQAVVDAIVADGGKAIFVPADVTKEEEVQNLFKVAVDTYGELHYAVNNAGQLCATKRLHEMDTKHFEDIIDVNLNSVFYCCKEELRIFLEQGIKGSIVNVSSVNGLVTSGRASAYVASKHGVNGLTRSVSFDYAKDGIRCNAICPAGTDTKLYREAGQAIMGRVQQFMMEGKTQEEAMALAMPGGKGGTPLEGPATADQQASTILYLLSDEAAHITGTCMATDNGQTAY